MCSIEPIMCSIEPRTRKNVKGYGFLSFARNMSNKYGNPLDTATKKVAHKAAEATRTWWLSRTSIKL